MKRRDLPKVYVWNDDLEGAIKKLRNTLQNNGLFKRLGIRRKYVTTAQRRQFKRVAAVKKWIKNNGK